MRSLWETAVVIGIVVLSVEWNSIRAATVLNSLCRQETCVAASQHCAYSGYENPPPCTWCYKDDPGPARGYCGWAVTSCAGEDEVNCGTIRFGLCSYNACSGGGGTNVECTVIKCTYTPPPVP
jgi:hypothetical protein